MINRVIAIVPSAGIGRRFGGSTNKPFATLGGRPLIIHTLEALEAVPDIKEIIPVVKESDMEFVSELLDQYHVPKVRRITPGGRERQDSVFHGLKLVDDNKSIVLVHDAVRPLIEPRIISDAINQLDDFEGVVVAVPVKDTIKEVQEKVVGRTLKRDILWSVQTPQIFRYGTIFQAYERAYRESYYATDDAALVEKYGGKVKVVMGSYTNIKITTPEDLMIAELFLEIIGGGLGS